MKLLNFFASLPKPVRKTIKCFMHIFVDPELLKDRKSISHPMEHVIRTWRYRLASVGIKLTDNEKKFRSLKNAYEGKRCFILGNGPSLNKCDLSLLKDEFTFGVNSIFLNREKMKFDPSFLVVQDVLVAEDRAEAINDYKPVKYKIYGNHLRPWLEHSNQTIWTNVRLRTTYPKPPQFSRNAIRCLYNCGTVSYINMQLAYYMGFDEVYLVGFDHSYSKPKDIKTDGQVWTSQSEDPNHFHPDYFGKGFRWHDPQVARMELGYSVARNEFELADKKIINATIGGELEVFERIEYSKLFKK